MSERVVRKKQGIKRARSISRMSQDESMEVDTKFQTKRVKPGRDVSGLRDAKQVSLRKPFLWLILPRVGLVLLYEVGSDWALLNEVW